MQEIFGLQIANPLVPIIHRFRTIPNNKTVEINPEKPLFINRINRSLLRLKMMIKIP